MKNLCNETPMHYNIHCVDISNLTKNQVDQLECYFTNKYGHCFVKWPRAASSKELRYNEEMKQWGFKDTPREKEKTYIDVTPIFFAGKFVTMINKCVDIGYVYVNLKTFSTQEKDNIRDYITTNSREYATYRKWSNNPTKDINYIFIGKHSNIVDYTNIHFDISKYKEIFIKYDVYENRIELIENGPSIIVQNVDISKNRIGETYFDDKWMATIKLRNDSAEKQLIERLDRDCALEFQKAIIDTFSKRTVPAVSYNKSNVSFIKEVALSPGHQDNLFQIVYTPITPFHICDKVTGTIQKEIRLSPISEEAFDSEIVKNQRISINNLIRMLKCSDQAEKQNYIMIVIHGNQIQLQKFLSCQRFKY